MPFCHLKLEEYFKLALISAETIIPSTSSCKVTFAPMQLRSPLEGFGLNVPQKHSALSEFIYDPLLEGNTTSAVARMMERN